MNANKMRQFESIFQPVASKSVNNSFRMWLALLTDCDVTNWPSATDGTMTVTPLKEGKEWVHLDVTAKSVDPKVTKDNEDDLEGRITLTPVLEGITGAALQWIYDHNGMRVVCIYQRCSDGQKFIAGSPCSGGLLLTYTEMGTQDGNVAGIKLMLKGNKCPEPIYAASFSISPQPTPPTPPEPQTIVVRIYSADTTSAQYWGGWNSDETIQGLNAFVSEGSVMRSVILLGDENHNTTLMPPITRESKTYYPIALTIPNEAIGLRRYHVSAELRYTDAVTVITFDQKTTYENVNCIQIEQNIVAIDEPTESFYFFPIAYAEKGELENNHGLFTITNV